MLNDREVHSSATDQSWHAVKSTHDVTDGTDQESRTEVSLRLSGKPPTETPTRLLRKLHWDDASKAPVLFTRMLAGVLV